MTPKKRQQEYQALRQQLSGMGWISEGYAQNRGRGAGGPCFQWTRKVKGKTVSVALSEAQFDALTKAIKSWKKTKRIIKRMQQLCVFRSCRTVIPISVGQGSDPVGQ
jgi:hypothetical protein